MDGGERLILALGGEESSGRRSIANGVENVSLSHWFSISWDYIICMTSDVCAQNERLLERLNVPLHFATYWVVSIGHSSTRSRT